MKGWNEEKGRRRGIHGTTFILSSAVCFPWVHLWAKKGEPQLPLKLISKQRSRENSILLLPFPEHQAHLEPELSPSFGTTSWPCNTASDLRFGPHLKLRTSFCVHLFYLLGSILTALYHINHRTDTGALQIGLELGDNYFSISVIPVARIYSQFTACNITHSHSSSSAHSSSLLLSFSFPVAWGLSLHES